MKHWFSDVRAFQKDQLQFFLDAASTSSAPAIRLRLGPKAVWLITDPDLARDLLKNDERTVDKGHFVRKLKPIVGESLLTINGEENQRRRRALHQVLSKGSSQNYMPELAATIRAAMVNLAQVESFDALDFTASLTLRMICVALFGKDVLSRGDENLVIAAVRLYEADLAREIFRAYPQSPWAAAAQARRRRDAKAMMDSVVHRVRHRAIPGSALSALIGLGLDENAIRDEIVTMLIAGHHTTGAAAFWVLYHLANSPDIASLLADEALRVQTADGEISQEALLKAPESTNFVKEILRLYPSAHWFSRDARQDIKTENQTIAAGDSMIICPWQLHRDERYWSKPHQFSTARSFTSKAYIPFGAGPRACIGISLASTNLQMIALEFASTYQLSFVGGAPTDRPVGAVTLLPPPMKLRAGIRPPCPADQMIAAE